MTTFRITHEIRCGVDRFWQVFLDQDFTTRLFTNVLQFPEFRILDQSETDTEIIRHASARPKLGWFQSTGARLMGSPFAFLETGIFDKRTRIWKWDLKPTHMPDRLLNRGTVSVASLGPDRCSRTVEVTLEAKMPLLGHMLERSAVRRIQGGWEKSAAFINETLPDGTV